MAVNCISAHTPPQRLDWKSCVRRVQQYSLDKSHSTASALAQTRKWIEECTGCVQDEKTYREYLQDGTLLCELVQRVHPGLIRKINRVRSPFAWRDNLSFFLEACQQLGLKGSQLFSLEDLQPSATGPYRNKGSATARGENERRLRNVANTIFWLGRKVKDIPDYSGPLLNSDFVEFGELQPPLKTTLTLQEASDITLQVIQNPLATTTNPAHSLPEAEPGKTVESPGIRVSKLESVESQTDKQSFAQVVLYVRGSNKHHQKDSNTPVCPEEREESFSLDHLAESEKNISELAHSESQESKPFSKQSGDSGGTLIVEPQETAEEGSNSPVLLGDLPSFLSDSRDSLRSPSFESTTTSSEVSTVILREQSSSRCSGASFISSEDCGGTSSIRSEFSETESSFNSPLTKRRHPSTDLVFTHESNPFSPTISVIADTQEEEASATSLQSSPPQLSNPTSLPISSTGLLPLDFLRGGSNSQESDCIGPYISPREEDTAFHFNLTGSQTSQPEDFGNEYGPSIIRRASSDSLGESSYPLAPPPAGIAGTRLRLISEEPERESTVGESSISATSSKTRPTKASLSSSQLSSALTAAKPNPSARSEASNEEGSDRNNLSELLSKSLQSSTDSINSAASSSSAIVVSYCERSRQVGEEVSDISHTPASLNYTSSFSSSSRGSNQDDSFAESSPEQEKSRNRKYQLKLDSSNANFNNSGSPEVTGGYLPTCPEEPRTPTLENGMAGILTIFPSHSGASPGTTRATIPHHSLHVSSSTGSDSALPRRNSQGRTLYIVPNSSAGNATASPSSFGSGERAQGTATGTRHETRGPRSRESAYSEHHYDEVEIPVVLLPGEKLLGVNMAGGRGQGTYPRVQAIAGDTPASRSNLQCGDELMAVNGTPLCDTPHNEATGLLQRAASRGKLVLRVRRARGDSPAHRGQQGAGHGGSHTPSPEESSIGPSIMAVVGDLEEQVFSLPHNADSAPSSSLKVEGPDLSRVRSDALPHSLYAAKLVVAGGSSEVTDEEGGKGDVPDFLSDINSTAVEVGSDCKKLSISDSHRSTCSEIGSRDGLNTVSVGADSGSSLAGKAALGDGSKTDETSLVDTVLAVARRHTMSASETPEGSSPQAQSRGRGKRPVSAPAKARSLSASTSHTLPTSVSGAELRRLQEKRSSVDEERERRRANIHESARAALQYSARKKSSKTDSLPSHFRTSTLNKSLESEDDYASSSPQHSRTSSSPVSSPSLPTAAQHTPTSGTPSLSSSHTHTPSHAPSTPLNLRHLSIDETREASFTQIDEIWREVEGGEASEKDVGGESPSVSHPASELSSNSGKESDTNAGLAPQPSLAPSSSDNSPAGDPKRQTRELPQAGPRPRALEEVDSPALVSATLQPRSHSTPLRPMSATLPRGASAQGESGERSLRAKSFNTKGIESLLSSLRALNQRVGTQAEEEEFRLLEETLRSNTFKKAKEFHDTAHSLVVVDEDEAPKAVVRRVVPVAQAARHHLHHHTEASEEVDELRALLREPHVQALLFCHDKVSTRDLHVPDSPRFHRAAQDPVDIVLSASVLNFNPAERSRDSSAPLSRDVPTTRKEDATIVFLERTNRPLGCTIYKQEEAVFIGKLLKGCDAEQSEVLREGDELLEVNGVPVTGRSTDEIIRIMSAEPGTTLAFTIIPVHDDNIDLEYETKYVRAHFNYNGRLDEEIPCKALGLSFQKGDILEISNQDDPFWWQARKVFDDGAESLPGLIPARHLQQKREALVRSYPMSPATESRRKGIMSVFSKKKKKKIYYQQTPQSGVVTVGDEVVTYEDVVKVDPDSERNRPIVLIGAPGIGRRTLIRKLLNSDSVHFAAVVQHTTRPIRPGEVNGHNYYFTTKEEFEQEVQQERFLEYGELRGHYYGTSFIAIKRIIEEGRVPVLDVQPQALKVLRYSGLHPYVVFVASPRLERLHITRKMGSEKQKRRSSSQLNLDDPPVYTEADLHHLVEESYLIESQYGHYFDWIIVNDDFQVASDMLKEVARRVEDEPQWVPATWVQDL